LENYLGDSLKDGGSSTKCENSKGDEGITPLEFLRGL
jgi:hypothetical protein